MNTNPAIREQGTARLRTEQVLDALIISDLHLGSPMCRDRELLEFLHRIVHGELKTRRLILNGDVFDSIDFRRLKRRHWKILSVIRKLSDRITITWVCGNHDGPAEPISQLLGVDVRNEYSLRSGRKSVLVLHGHVFDEFIETYPRITFFADLIFRFLQWIDPSHRFARSAKINSKVFLRCAEKVRIGATRYAQSSNHHIVCCGHTHHPEYSDDGRVIYVNSGSWTELPCTFVAVSHGSAGLYPFEPVESFIRDAQEEIPTPQRAPA